MGNTGQALSNLTQPYLASAIGTYFDNLERQPDGTMSHEYAPERLLAHAAAGAAIAYLSGNHAASGATGAASGEAMAIIVHQQMYDGKPTDQLTTAEKENIRAVATLASGLAGALQGGSFESAATSAAAGYNAAVNNETGLRQQSSRDWLINELQKARDSGDVAQYDRLLVSNSGVYTDYANIDRDRKAALNNQKYLEDLARYAQSSCNGMSIETCKKQFDDIRVDNANLFFSTFIPSERLAVLGIRVVRGVVVAEKIGAITFEKMIATASVAYKNTKFTVAGRAATKHPEYFGFESTEAMSKVYGTPNEVNKLAEKLITEIAAHGTKTVGAGGR